MVWKGIQIEITRLYSMNEDSGARMSKNIVKHWYCFDVLQLMWRRIYQRKTIRLMTRGSFLRLLPSLTRCSSNTPLRLLDRNSRIHLNSFRPFSFDLIHNRRQVWNILQSILVHDMSEANERMGAYVFGFNPLVFWKFSVRYAALLSDSNSVSSGVMLLGG